MVPGYLAIVSVRSRDGLLVTRITTSPFTLPRRGAILTTVPGPSSTASEQERRLVRDRESTASRLRW